ncbi:hypothetical protein EDB85DRAFT_1895017 [Lactarius pseudohatsudake]|nr:hypothetical protein EDB85DRAFT_1895017 [Lactarius pseudohatsudake]
MLALAQWANTSVSVDFSHGHNGPIQACRQISHMGTTGQYKLVGRMLVLAQWANDMCMGTVCQYKDVHMSTIGQRKLVGRMRAPAQWANTSFSKDTHMSTMGQYKLFGRMHT